MAGFLLEQVGIGDNVRYADIADKTNNKHSLQQSMRRAHLYSEIWRDVEGILKILLPTETALEVGTKIKGIMVNLIELKTGKRPDKI